MNKIKIYKKGEIEQGSPEWFKVRQLKFTASNASEIAACGAGLETLVKSLLQDYYSSLQYAEYSQKYKNENMQRGNDFEAMARMIYEFETGGEVEEVGFVEVNKHVGCSPDGLVGDDGLVEIKNHSDKVFLELILTGKIDPKYVKQMQYQMYCTGRPWCDYMGFNPNFSPSHYIKRFTPDKELFKKFDEGIKKGVELLEANKKILYKKLQKPAEVLG